MGRVGSTVSGSEEQRLSGALYRMDSTWFRYCRSLQEDHLIAPFRTTSKREGEREKERDREVVFLFPSPSLSLDVQWKRAQADLWAEVTYLATVSCCSRGQS